MLSVSESESPDRVLDARSMYTLLIPLIADFISHSTKGPKSDEISTVIKLVGTTATKFLHQDPVQQLQFRHNKIDFITYRVPQAPEGTQ